MNPPPQLSFHGPCNLPLPSLGSLFKGRETLLNSIHEALTDKTQIVALTGRALHGLSGVGKTRAAIEYAWHYNADYTAILFLRAGTPDSLATSLATLANPKILDLPEQDAKQDYIRGHAALRWLETNPGWLLILDNVDNQRAAEAIQDLLAHLTGGHIVITGRISKFPATVTKLDVGALEASDSAAFLLGCTNGREFQPDDNALARELGSELGGLALSLEQAAAYIAAEHISFSRYLDLWRAKRETVLDWFEDGVTGYSLKISIAATWATSVEKLSAQSRCLLERLSLFAPEPVPKTLLDFAMPGDDASYNAHSALTSLYAYALVSEVRIETKTMTQPGFAVHRLIQNYTQRSMSDERWGEALDNALLWVNEMFFGCPTTERYWQVLEPLIDHVLILASCGEDAMITEPTGRLYNYVGSMFQAKERYSEAEHAMRCALAMGEAHYGRDDSNVAIALNNLAGVLEIIGQTNEATSLYQRSLKIFEANYGPGYSRSILVRKYLARLLEEPASPHEPG